MASSAKSKKLEIIINIVPNLSLQTTKNLNRSWNTKVGVHQMVLNKDAQVKFAILVWTKMGD